MNPASEPAAAPRRWPGCFVVLEGIDGTGKSTLARALRDEIEALGIECLLSGEPTDGPYGKKIRALAVSGRENVSAEDELGLFIADRKQHLRERVMPMLSRGGAAILDRYYYSSIAYQGARGLDPNKIEALHREFAPEPDLLVILELGVPEALDRIKLSRGGAPDLFEKEEYLREVSRIFSQMRHPNLMRLDARRPTAELAAAILDRMGPWIAQRGRNPA